MSDAITLPSDLYDPVYASEYAAYVWYENNTVIENLARQGDPTSPIQMNSGSMLINGGTVSHNLVLKPISGLDTKRDLTSQSNVDSLKFSNRDDKGVRISRKIGPVSFSQSGEWLSGLGRAQLSEFFAREAVNNMKLTLRKHAIAVAVGAITNMTSSLHTKSVWAVDTTRTNLTTGLLASTKAKLGDAIDRVGPGTGAAWVFRSEPYAVDLIGYQLGQGVQGISDRASAGANALTLGLPYQLADDDSLFSAQAGNGGADWDKYYSLLLGPGCLRINVLKLAFTPLWMNPSSENVQFVMRADYDFEISVPGFAWHTATGTNPSLTTAGTSTNWDVTYSDAREILMAMAVHNYSASS